MTNEELIKALRGCKDIEFCTDCPMLPNGLLTESCHIKDIAADALEDAEKRIEELERSFSDVCNANGSLACERNKLLNDVRELEARLPKEGEWKSSYPEIESNPMFMYGICSICGFEQSISNKLNYCPNCGARMKGEQE